MKLNKKMLTLVCLSGLSISALAGGMRKPYPVSKTAAPVQMKKGTMQVHDYGSIKMHVYNTQDLMDDYVFILEKAGKALIIESPAFYTNFDELRNYLVENKINIEGILTPYHPLGATFIQNEALADTPVYMTQTVLDFWETGFGSVMKQGIPKHFGTKVDSAFYKQSVLLDEGKTKIAGIQLIITDTYDGFNIEIPEIKAVYLHILGHDAHSEILGHEHLDEMIESLENYTDHDYITFLSSHYRPETKEDAFSKIEYLKGMKKVVAESTTGEEFIKNMKAAYPTYTERYLPATAKLFYSEAKQEQ